MKAIWNDIIVAESDDTVIVENNHYFPVSSLNMEYFRPTQTTTVCGWKGTANYYTITINGDTNIDAAWYYADPKKAAIEIKDRIAFWRGVKVIE